MKKSVSLFLVILLSGFLAAEAVTTTHAYQRKEGSKIKSVKTRAAQRREMQQQIDTYAAAAKFNYDEDVKKESNLKNNYHNSSSKSKTLKESNLKNNYHQSTEATEEEN